MIQKTLLALRIGVVAALVSGSAGTASASPPPFFLPPFGGVAPFGSRSTSGPDGIYPNAKLVDVNGVLYGTTVLGGKYNQGTVFAVTPTGKERVLHSFGSGTDGSQPAAGLINVCGVLYGTTYQGGKGYGTVFAVTAAGQEHVVYNFLGQSSGDGELPAAGLIDVDGVLYGTTSLGGEYNIGTVFAVTTTGQERVLHVFAGGTTDGRYPEAGLVEVNGVVYGTTTQGGQYGEGPLGGFGTVFAVNLRTGQEGTLHSFGNGTDGASPVAGLIDVNGVLYSTTTVGGTYKRGTVFAMTPSGQESVLYSFGKSTTDGSEPYGGLIDVEGVLYGTTLLGGKYKGGTVFAVAAAGRERVLHSFAGGTTDGFNPGAGLIDVNDVLYGTTTEGGQYGEQNGGTVFGVTPTGQLHVIHSFGG